MEYHVKKNQGIIKAIFLIIIAVIILSYLKFDLRDIWNSEMVQKNFSYIFEALKSLWTNYLARPFGFIWREAIEPLIDICWNSFKAGLAGLKGSNK